MYSHAPLTDSQTEALQPPDKKDRSLMPKGKSEKRANSKGREMYRFNFFKAGTCAREDCPWAHLTLEQVTAQGLDKSNTAKAKALAISSASPLAMPCVESHDDDREEEDGHVDRRCRAAVMCVEASATAVDELDDRLLIGRKHEEFLGGFRQHFLARRIQ